MELEPGTRLGPYRIVAPLGRGGMGSVYRAHDAALERHVALKVLPAEFLHDPAFAERFRREAQVAAKLEHPHVVPVYAYGIEAGRPWMAMRLVAGGSLAQRVQAGPLSPVTTTALLRDVAEALDYAHARDVVHRDVKPANVLLDETGRAYLADFGIARMLEGSSVATATGLVLGTPTYMAPEQAMGAKVDRLADVYALGVMAFECLTGRVPYTGTTPVAILMKHVQEPVPVPSPAELAPPLTAVLKRCLAKTPTDRWPSAGAFVGALEQASAGLTEDATLKALPTLEVSGTASGPPDGGPAPRPSPADRRIRWAAACVSSALLVVAVGVLLLWRLTAPAGISSPAQPPSPSPPLSRADPRARPSPNATPWTRGASGVASPAPVGTTPAPAALAAPAPTSPPRDRDAAPPVTARRGRIRVYCEAKLEPVFFRKTDLEDVTDSLANLQEAFLKHGVVEMADHREQADAVVQVLERGREPALIGMRKVRVRVVVGGESVELAGQDSIKGFNTWSGAANGAAKHVEAWLERRFGASRKE